MGYAKLAAVQLTWLRKSKNKYRILLPLRSESSVDFPMQKVLLKPPWTLALWG